jgi:DUF1365 family protein
MTASSLYSGSIMHRRLKPRRHRFRYRAWWMLIDLDDLASASRRLRLFSFDRFNLVSFHPSDHGHDDRPLRSQVEDRLRGAGIEPDGGPIRLLCMPRVLTYTFNPLSIYFCHDRQGSLVALVYEVHNTFGERHSYTVPALAGDDGAFRHSHDKHFYVSPFMAMEMAYDFRVRLMPDHSLTVAIAGSDVDGPVVQAVLRARRRDLTDGGLVRLLISQPLIGLKVVAAIHWEALRLWCKRIPMYARPRAHAPGTSNPSDAKTLHARH